MPTYRFKNLNTNEEYEVFMSMSERESYMKIRPNVVLIFTPIALTGDHIMGIGPKPDSGFTESILLGVPAFSFWNKKLIRYQPDAEHDIKSLLDVGVFNENGQDMAKNVSACIEDKKWWNKTVRKMSIDNFMSHYIKTSTHWKPEWSSLLNNLE